MHGNGQQRPMITICVFIVGGNSNDIAAFYPAAIRNGNTTSTAYDNIGIRVTLYL